MADDTICRYVKEELDKVRKTLSTTSSSSDSYNMGWLEGKEYALKDVLRKCEDIQACSNINATTVGPKIFTFRFSYDCPVDDFGYIDFCAASLEEAEELFYTWAQEDAGCDSPVYTDCEVIYDPDDAEEYGASYGTPQEYRD